MEVEIRLKKLLKGLMRRGICAQMARDIGLSWRTIKKYIDGERDEVSLEHVGRICHWLDQHGLGEGLPGAILGYRPSSLLQALAEPGLVTIYQSEYRPLEDEPIARAFLSRDDAAVDSTITEVLSKAVYEGVNGAIDDAPGRPRGVRFEHMYVPCHFPRKGECPKEQFERDVALSREYYEQMRSPYAESSVCIVGSPRGNYVGEHWVAGLHGCEPFEPGSGSCPFYLRYRVQRAPSCCGGGALPEGCDVDEGPGIYFRDEEGRWVVYPSTKGGADAGMVILRRDAGEGGLEMAIFGLSARATAAMGEILRWSPDRFWPAANGKRGGVEVSVYACRLEVIETACTKQRGRSIRIPRQQITLVPALEPCLV